MSMSIIYIQNIFFIQDFASKSIAHEMIGQFFPVMFVVSIRMLVLIEDNCNISYICYIYDMKRKNYMNDFCYDKL